MRQFSKEDIEDILIQWFKDNHGEGGDDYYAHSVISDAWIVGFVNDYPLRHGEGKKVLLYKEQVQNILERERERKPNLVALVQRWKEQDMKLIVNEEENIE